MKIFVNVVFALPEAQEFVEVELEEGATLEVALKASGFTVRHPEIDLRTQRIGVWGRVATLGTALRDRDRVEIYRPLSADPKQARRLRAAVERHQKRHR